MMQAIILAGGLGSRLRNIISDRPKAMAPISGKPFLEYLIILLQTNGISDILLLTGHKSEMIESYFEDGSKWMVKINYSKETIPLGTAGALFNAWNCLSDNFILLNGDSIFVIDYNRTINFFRERDIGFLIILKEIADVKRYGHVRTSPNYLISSFVEKNESEAAIVKGMINGGVYFVKKNLLEKYFMKWDNNFISLEKDIFPKLLKEKCLYGLGLKGEFIDIGVPEDYNKAQTYIPKIVKSRSQFSILK